VSAGGFYRYFASKADVVAAIAEDTAEALERIVSEAATGAESLGDFAARLIDGVAAFDRESGRGAVAVQVWAEAARNPEIRALVLRVAGRASRTMAIVTESREEARVLLAITQGFLLQRAWDRKLSAGAFSDAVRNLFA
jgi:AcrR family transcriptional regulator